MSIEEAKDVLFKMPKNGTRVAVIFAIINVLLVFANLYLSNGYVSRAAYEVDQKDVLNRREQLNAELKEIAVELRGIKDHMQGDDRQDKRIDSAENRLLELERKK